FRLRDGIRFRDDLRLFRGRLLDLLEREERVDRLRRLAEFRALRWQIFLLGHAHSADPLHRLVRRRLGHRRRLGLRDVGARLEATFLMRRLFATRLLPPRLFATWLLASRLLASLFARRLGRARPGCWRRALRRPQAVSSRTRARLGAWQRAW